MSLLPGTSLTIRGIPAAIASIITIPKLSINEGKIKISETLYSLIKSKDGKYKFFALVNENLQIKNV